MKLIEWLLKEQFYKPNRKDSYKTDDEKNVKENKVFVFPSRYSNGIRNKTKRNEENQMTVMRKWTNF